MTPRRVQAVYLFLLTMNTLAASSIWGINTLFLLDAGLSNGEAFAANAAFTAGLALFEVPTGVVADTRGRRASYLYGTLTLAVTTLLYLWMWRARAPFWAWAAVSALLGLGFSFFSGAVEAWLVDALAFTGYAGKLEDVLARGKIAEGVAMLGGSAAGGALAQATNLGAPYVVRAGILGVTFVCAALTMRDLGFTPEAAGGPLEEMRRVLERSIRHGLGNRPVRWVMLAAPFTMGVGIYAFYALQPYLLRLHGDPHAYGVAGLAAAIVAGAQIAGGFLVPFVGRLFRRRVTVMALGAAVSVVALAVMGLVPSFWTVISVVVVWALVFSAIGPVRQAYLNALIDSRERATVLSFDSLFGSSGGVVFQPLLGRAADVWGYPASYVFAAAGQALALPFLFRSRAEGGEAARAADRLG